MGRPAPRSPHHSLAALVRSDCGFGLVGVMVASAIMCTVALGMTSFMTKFSQNVQSMRLIATRDDIRNRIESYARNPVAVYAISQNSSYAGTNAGTTGQFNDCALNYHCGQGSTNQVGFYMTDPSGAILGGPSGTVFFQPDGSSCTSAVANCLLEVDTSVYTTSCTSGTTCSNSTSLTVAYTIKQSAATNNYVRLKSVSGSLTVSLPLPTTLTQTPLKLAKYDSSGANLGSSVSVSEDPTGNVGVSNTAPAALLHVGSAATAAGNVVAKFQTATGTCTMTPASSGSGIACSSDERLKKDIRDVSASVALDRLLQLQAVTYVFRKDPARARHTGYIAQEVREITPEFVREDSDGTLQIYYDGFVPWITESFKALNSKFAVLEKENASLKHYICLRDPEADFCKGT